jgi:hypothetical protein
VREVVPYVLDVVGGDFSTAAAAFGATVVDRSSGTTPAPPDRTGRLAPSRVSNRRRG